MKLLEKILKLFGSGVLGIVVSMIAIEIFGDLYTVVKASFTGDTQTGATVLVTFCIGIVAYILIQESKKSDT